jgi:hypothetical protein
VANFESEGDVVPMLCPGCCKLDDIPDWAPDPGNLKILAGCHRCGFTFPILPGDFRGLTLHALLNHRCKGPDDGHWDAVSKAIVGQLDELVRDPDKFGGFIDAAFAQPQGDTWGYEDNSDERERNEIRPGQADPSRVHAGTSCQVTSIWTHASRN